LWSAHCAVVSAHRRREGGHRMCLCCGRMV
jgi:hypothetical protein